MSLVAYDSSGGSDDSDIEEEAVSNDVRVTLKTNNNPTTTSTSSAAHLQPPASSSSGSSSNQISDDEDDVAPSSSVSHHGGHLLSGLPAPKPTSVIDAFQYEEDVVEDEYKKLPGTNLNLPKKPPKKVKQPVKIAALSAVKYDSDSEDDEPSKKKQRFQGSGKGGLTAMLPAPKNVSVKEVKRSLIPHTLTKRPTPKPKPAAARSKPPVKPKVTKVDSDEEDDDDDGAEVSFFSISDKPTATTTKQPAAPETYGPPRPAMEIDSRPSLSGLKLPEPTVTADTSSSLPYDSSYSSVPGADYTNYGQYYDYGANAASDGAGTAEQYPVYSETSGQYLQHNETQVTEETPGSSEHQFQNTSDLLQDEEFLKIQGKRYRGKEPINIIDVHADDQCDPLELTKQISQETEHFTHSKKKGGNLPSSTEKRKHQITYLAHQAKERELSLKNQWAQNRSTQRHARSKYGF